MECIIDFERRHVCYASGPQRRSVHGTPQAGASVATQYPDGTALHVAAQHGAVRTAALLLRRGASFAARNRVGELPLHVAAR